MPYGYEIGDEGRLVLGEANEVATVRTIFRLRADEGLGYGTIAKKLNAKQVPAPRGGIWNVPCVRNILMRETYTGNLVYGVVQRAKHYTITAGEVSRVKRGAAKQPPMIIKGAHPAIIDAKTWKTCAALTTCSIKFKAHGRKDSEGAPLASLLYCGRCGSAMYAVCYGLAAARLIYVRAITSKGGCGHCSVPQAPALRMVATIIRERVLEGSLEALEAAISKRLGKPAQETNHNDTLQQIADVDRKIANAMERLVSVNQSLVPGVERKLLAMQAQRDQLAQQWKAKPVKQKDAKAIAAQLWRLEEVLAKGSPAKVRFALSKIVKRVTLNFEPGKKTGQRTELRLRWRRNGTTYKRLPDPRASVMSSEETKDLEVDLDDDKKSEGTRLEESDALGN